MSEFICRLGTPSGEIITRVVEAGAAADARSALERDGFRVFSISSAAANKNRSKRNEFLLFNQQFSALLRAGIPVLQSIELLKTRSTSAALRGILADVEERIKSGASLSEAFEAQGVFPKIYTASI